MDIEQYLTPVSEDSPAGEDLEYDPEFGELDRTAQGTPEKRTGDHIIEAVPPDWKAVREQCNSLFERTRDLRVAVLLTRAQLHDEGYQGLRDGLSLIEQLSEKFWETVHPALDEDDGDPTMRCNALRELVNREGLLQEVLDAPIVSARVAGRFSLRDLKVIAGELKPRETDDHPPPQRQLVEAAFQEVGDEEVTATAQTLAECLDGIEKLNSVYVTQLGVVDAPDLSDLTADLKEVQSFVARQMARLGLGGDTTESNGEGEAEIEASGGAGAVAGTSISGDVRSRDDVVRMLDKICLYYQQQEPSSPVPILLRRAASLVNKDFMEIVADLTPSGVSEAALFAPSQADSSDGWSSGEGEAESKDDSW